MIKRLSLALVVFVCLLSSTITCFADDTKDPAYVVMDANTGEILVSQNADERYFPASTTKVLTIALALENGDLNSTVVLDEHVRDRVEWDCTDADMYPGEELRLCDLIAAASLLSANEACNGIAQLIDGSQEKFVDRMNQKVADLGLTNTHFVTTNGLHDENHYTTASDLAKIMRYCVQVPGFTDWLSLPSYTIPKTNQHEARALKQGNPLLLEGSDYYVEGIQCAKTGFTDQAGSCMVAYYEHNGQGLIAVVLNEKDTLARTTQTHDLFVDTLANSQYIAVSSSLYQDLLSQQKAKYLTINGDLETIEQAQITGFTIMNDQVYQLEWESSNVKFGKDSHLGNIHILVDDQEVGLVEVYAKGYILSTTVYVYLLEGIALVLLAGIVGYILIGQLSFKQKAERK